MNHITAGSESCKYADNIYVIIPAVSVDTRSAELQNIADWAAANNVTLNLNKSDEIIFVDKRTKNLMFQRRCRDV